MLGGEMIPVRRTGEMRYIHPAFQKTIRANDRRTDVPAVLLSRINQLLRTYAENDPIWEMVK
jgi:negative regulator of sigma E activity